MESLAWGYAVPSKNENISHHITSYHIISHHVICLYLDLLTLYMKFNRGYVTTIFYIKKSNIYVRYLLFLL